MYVQRNSSVKPYFEKQYFTKNHVIDFFSFHTGVLHDILYKSFMKVIGTVKNSRKSQETVKGHWNQGPRYRGVQGGHGPLKNFL